MEGLNLKVTANINLNACVLILNARGSQSRLISAHAFSSPAQSGVSGPNPPDEAGCAELWFFIFSRRTRPHCSPGSGVINEEGFCCALRWQVTLTHPPIMHKWLVYCAHLRREFAFSCAFCNSCIGSRAKSIINLVSFPKLGLKKVSHCLQYYPPVIHFIMAAELLQNCF